MFSCRMLLYEYGYKQIPAARQTSQMLIVMLGDRSIPYHDNQSWFIGSSCLVKAGGAHSDGLVMAAEANDNVRRLKGMRQVQIVPQVLQASILVHPNLLWYWPRQAVSLMCRMNSGAPFLYARSLKCHLPQGTVDAILLRSG